MPKPSIEGTQIPTKTPASFCSSPNTPNQSDTEKRNDIKAATKIA